MICRVCLLDSTEQVEIFGTVGVELGVASVISQHFWFEPKLDDPISNIICNPCWRKLDSFHIFYNSVEEAHSQLSERFFVKEEPGIKNEGGNNIRLEFHVMDEKGHIFNISEPDYFNNEWNQQNSLGSENTECVPADEESMHVAEPLEDKNTNEYSSNAEEGTRSQSTESLKDKADDEDFPEKLVPSAEEESSKVQSRRRTRERSLLRQKCANRKGSENTNDSFPDHTSRQSQLKEKYQLSKHFKISKKDDETIAKHMKLKCEICGAEFSMFAEVSKHYRSVHNQIGYVVCCNRKLRNRVAILGHINRHLNPDYFKCKECSKIFSDRQALATHKLRHFSEEAKIYKSDKCPRRYASTHVCNICGKAYASKNGLRSHVRYVHDQKRLLQCSVCDKAFISQKGLREHVATHTGKPLYTCSYCPQTFKSRTRKYAHRKEVHRKEWEDNRRSRGLPTSDTKSIHSEAD